MPESTPREHGVRSLDKFAITLSGLCLVHCLAVPFALFFGPFLGGWLSASETTVHWILLGLAAPSSAVALSRGYIKHRSAVTLILGILGIGLMFVGVSHWYGDEVLLTVCGVTMLLVAHVRNLTQAHGAQHRH